MVNEVMAGRWTPERIAVEFRLYQNTQCSFGPSAGSTGLRHVRSWANKVCSLVLYRAEHPGLIQSSEYYLSTFGKNYWYISHRQKALCCPQSSESATQSSRAPWRVCKHRQNASFSERGRLHRVGGFAFISHACLCTRSLLYRTRGLECWTQFFFTSEAFAF
jgi:hypothetical protein